MGFLPINNIEMQNLGWESCDFVYVCGDAYVDHPSFGHAIISRLLESKGYKVAMLCQPNWKDTADFKQFGRPRLGFLVTSGVIDSMVNHYTANKKPRAKDLYSPGGVKGKRPNRAVNVYCNLIRQAYKDVPIIIGGIEASLRRFAHYDYWDNVVRKSILVDSDADLLIYGMGETPIVEIADMLDRGIPVSKIKNVRGTVYRCAIEKLPKEIKEAVEKNEKVEYESFHKHYNSGIIPVASYEKVLRDKFSYAHNFKTYYEEQDGIRGATIVQQHGDSYVVQNPPGKPLSVKEMDAVYALPYERTWHPSYDALGGIPAFDEVEFSITSHRGCFGGCSFCALNYHQGRIIQKRSKESIFDEADILRKSPKFKGYIHDIGGPTANFREKACKKQEKEGTCKNRQCMFPTPCKNLNINYKEYLSILRHVRKMDGVKKVFIRSGIRFDHLMLEKGGELFKEICKHHVSGQLKVAPEHVDDTVLALMGKPKAEVFDKFCERYYAINEKNGSKQYLVPYLIASHPGSDLNAAINLAVYLKKNKIHPEQVQNFYPTPGTLSTAMYYTGYDPRTMKPIYVPRSNHERAMQRALLQYSVPKNADLVREALRVTGREYLIGYGKNCIVPPSKANMPNVKRKNGANKPRKSNDKAYKKNKKKR